MKVIRANRAFLRRDAEQPQQRLACGCLPGPVGADERGQPLVKIEGGAARPEALEVVQHEAFNEHPSLPDESSPAGKAPASLSSRPAMPVHPAFPLSEARYGGGLLRPGA
jgi:hypothetical protein